MSDQKYWPIGQLARGAVLELRAELAWSVIQNFGMIAGKGSTTGVTVGDFPIASLQTPEEVVSRAFALADLFVSKAEARGEIRLADRYLGFRDEKWLDEMENLLYILRGEHLKKEKP